MNNTVNLSSYIETAPYSKLVDWSNTISQKYSLGMPPDDETELRNWLMRHAAKEERYAFHNIPAELKNATRWVCWKQEERDGKLTKIPYDIRTYTRASSTDPGTWGNYEQAIVAYHQHDYDGIGFMFHENDGYVGIDWDHVRDAETGEWDPDTYEEIIRFQSYAEISPSHTGAHCIVKGKKPGERCRKGDYEMYSKDRYFTFTGHHIDGTPLTINETRPELIDAFYRKISDDETTTKSDTTGDQTNAPERLDDEIVDLAHNASNGEKFKALWSGSWAGTYPSQSEADEALCFMLAFYTKNPSQIDRIFRKSKLYREKWDREDYRNKTIGLAVIKVTEGYKEPDKRPPGKTTPTDIIGPYALTDSGFAKLIHSVEENGWFYLFNENEWYRWNGKHWELDKTGRFIALVKKKAMDRLIDSVTAGTKEQSKFYLRCCDSNGISNVIKASRDLFAIAPEQKDALTNSFPVKNGIYNLETHEFIPEHVREQYLTQIADVEYQHDSVCPFWLKHLDLVFEGDTEMIGFFQEVAGYTLLYDNPAQVFIILYGEGKNGKSVTREVFSLILDRYSKSAPIETIMKRKNQNDGGAARGDLIHISKARMVLVSEGNPDQELAAGLIKQMTGGETMYARNPYAKYGVEHKPGYKIWFVTNHLPLIDGADYALMRRIFLIPFHAIIPEEKRVDHYAEILYEREGPGILNWMLEGLKRYQKRGRFNLPKKVNSAIQKYRTDSDILLEWMQDCCIKEQGAREQRSILYSSYKLWCEDTGVEPVKQASFWKSLKNKGVETEEVWVHRKRGCNGIRLKNKSELDEFYGKLQTE